MIKSKIIGTSFSKPNKCLLKKIPHCLQVPSQHQCEQQNKVFVINIYYIMDRDLGFHLFYGIFILVESFETRSANHCYHWPCMEISCLNRTLCSNGICFEPLVCLHRAAEGNKDKQWWETDSSTVNREVAFPGKLSTSQSPGENRWNWCGRKTLLLFSNSLPGSFPPPGISTLAYGGRRAEEQIWSLGPQRAGLYSGCVFGNCDLGKFEASES